MTGISRDISTTTTLTGKHSIAYANYVADYRIYTDQTLTGSSNNKP